MNRAWLRWLPAVVVPGVIAAGMLALPSPAGAASLPVKTGEQVLAMVAESSVRSLSGTLEQTANLGLPQLPAGESAAGADPASALDLLTGSHTARIYVDGPTNARLQVMDTFGERNVVRQGNDVWFYSYQTNAAVHLTLPTRVPADDDVARGDVSTPAQLARRFLASVDPSTEVTVGNDTTVAGRAAYELVIRPRDADTLVGSVSVAVDSETGLPLRFRVQARGQVKPAFELAFTSLSLRTPAADRFSFVPPPGATVREQAIAAWPATTMSPGTAGSVGDSLALLALLPAVSGSGWEAVIELPAGTLPPEVTDAPLFAQLTRAVAGGRLLQMTLVNVLLTDDGRAFVGSVPLERLQSAAAGT